MTPTASLKTTLSNSGTICLGLKEPNDPPKIVIKQCRFKECSLERNVIFCVRACIINNVGNQVDEMWAILDEGVHKFDE